MREPMLLFWGLGVPGRPAVVLGIAGGDKPQHSLGNVKLIVAYTPVVMMFVLTILALSALPADAGRPTATRAICGGCRRRRSEPSGCWPRRSSSTSARRGAR